MIGLSLFCAAAFAQASLAQTAHPVEGTYNVTASSSETGTVNFMMTLKHSGEKWTVEVKDSPTPLNITNTTVDETNKVTITADAGGTEVSIIGKFENGEITGEWSAGDIKGTWKGTKSAEAVSAEKSTSTTARPSAETLSAIEGTYDAKVSADGQGELTFTLVIKRDGDKLITEVPNAGDLNIVGIAINEDVITLSATFQGNPFQLPGKLTGGEMGGKWNAGGFSGDWSAKKK